MAQPNKAASAPRALNSQQDYDLARRALYQEKQRDQGLGQVVNKGEVDPVAGAEGSEQVAKRQLYKEKQQAVHAPLNIPGSADRHEEEAKLIDQTGGQLSLEDQQGGIAGALARQRQKNAIRREQAERAKAGLASGDMVLEEANAVILKAYQGIWSALHEVFEDLALSFIDLMILSGPMCILLFTGRVIGMLSVGQMFKIKFKGLQVPIIPFFTMTEAPIRVMKFLLVLIISGAIWGVIALIIWIIVDPAGAAVQLLKSVVNSILTGLGLSTI